MTQPGLPGSFDAILFDAGGVLVLPDPTVLAPLLAPYGGLDDVDDHCHAHYAGMAAKSRAGSTERDWSQYNEGYIDHIGVHTDHRDHAIEILDLVRNAHLWRWPIPDTLAALAAFEAMGMPMGVVSNASGQVEAELARSGVCQEGPGEYVGMRCVIDSHVVGVAKPDPRIFEFALRHFEEFERDRIAYVGDSIMMDIGGAQAAGLQPILLDPYGHHVDADLTRISAVRELLPVG